MNSKFTKGRFFAPAPAFIQTVKNHFNFLRGLVHRVGTTNLAPERKKIMNITGVKCIQVGQGREYESHGEKRRDTLARCVNVVKDGSLTASGFFDYRLTDEEKKKGKELEGKMLELEVDNIRQPFNGAPVNFTGRVTKAV